MLLSSSRVSIGLGLALGLLAAVGPAPVSAHVVKLGDWTDTHAKLRKLFPKADPNGWKLKRHALSDDEVAAVEKQLRFSLYPEDKEPTFFFAQDADGNLLGVAMLIDPRPEPTVVNGEVVPMEIGIGVDASGAISHVELLEYSGHPGVSEPPFIEQLVGLNLACNFSMRRRGLTPVPDAREDSELVANAAREALVLMKTALGVDAPPKPCPR